MMVDFKVDALYRCVSIESLLKTGGVKKFTGNCISGWNSTCQPYIESATALKILIMTKSQQIAVFVEQQNWTSSA